MCRVKDRVDDIVIGDFGLSSFFTPKQPLKAPCGTLSYVAPEVNTKHTHTNHTMHTHKHAHTHNHTNTHKHTHTQSHNAHNHTQCTHTMTQFEQSIWCVFIWLGVTWCRLRIIS